MKKLKLWSMMMLAAMTMTLMTSCGGDDGGDVGNRPVNPDNPDPNAIISFKDNKVAMICIANFDINKDNQLSYGEAATVRTLGDVFAGQDITLFDELKYFTGLLKINNKAFLRCNNLVSITIPNSVTSIENSAFYQCVNLTSVNIGSGVTNIEENAFFACGGLKKVIVSDIAAWCGIKFGDYWTNPLSQARHLYSDENTEIKDLIIPNSVTSIGSHAFWECSGLTSVTIPNSVTSIGSSAFEGCSSLTSVTIPNSVTSIGGNAFLGCSGLTSIVVESGNGKYDSRNNCNALIETASNRLIKGCKNTIIPNSVTSIGGSAFWECSGLTSVTIPNSVTSIGSTAFSYCSGLTSVIIPNSVTSIGNQAFSSCSSLTSISIPNSVTSIGNYAFDGCSGLTSLVSQIVNPFAVSSILGDNFSTTDREMY